MMDSLHKRWIFQQILYSAILEEIDILFQKLQTKYMLIKGAYLICTKIAQQMKYRKMTDIDIVIEPKALKTVSDYFLAQHNISVKKYFTSNYRTTETSLWYHYDSIKICVELQTELNVPERFSLDTMQLFERAVQVGTYKYLPCPEDALIIFLCHLQTHIPFEFRETNFEEMGLLISQEGFSYTNFWRIAQCTGMGPFISFMFHVYNKRYKKSYETPKKFLYPFLLSLVFDEILYHNMTPLARRIFFDIPFVKKPFALFMQKSGLKKIIKRKCCSDRDIH